MKTTCVAAGFAAVILSAFWAQADPGEASLPAYANAVAVAREALHAVDADAPVHRIQESAKAIERLGLNEEDAGYAVFEYVRCRLLVLASLDTQAEEGLLALVRLRSVAPEAYLGLLEIHADDRRNRIGLEECLSMLLPISHWGVLSNERTGEFGADIDPPPPVIPVMDREAVSGVARAFRRIGFAGSAWKAYAESIYLLPPGWIKNPGGCSWFHPDTAKLWLTAAAQAWQADEISTAWDYLTKAAVFGSAHTREEALTTARMWQDADSEPQDDVPVARQREGLEKIIRLYCEINAHPRALDLINEHRAILTDSELLSRECCQEWQGIVKHYRRGKSKAVLYGVEITEDTDACTIRIPEALSDKAIDKARALLNDLIKPGQ